VLKTIICEKGWHIPVLFIGNWFDLAGPDHADCSGKAISFKIETDNSSLVQVIQDLTKDTVGIDGEAFKITFLQ